jgi:poly-D-alanine transfer protein DltD
VLQKLTYSNPSSEIFITMLSLAFVLVVFVIVSRWFSQHGINRELFRQHVKILNISMSFEKWGGKNLPSG